MYYKFINIKTIHIELSDGYIIYKYFCIKNNKIYWLFGNDIYNFITTPNKNMYIKSNFYSL